MPGSDWERIAREYFNDYFEPEYEETTGDAIKRMVEERERAMELQAQRQHQELRAMELELQMAQLSQVAEAIPRRDLAEAMGIAWDSMINILDEVHEKKMSDDEAYRYRLGVDDEV